MRNAAIALLFSSLLQNQKLFKFRKYFLNLLYVIVFNFVYYCFFHKHLLWDFKSKCFNMKLVRCFHVFFVTPMLNYFFILNFPRTLVKRIIYTVKWIILSVIAELTFKKCGCIFFSNGWHIGWSAYIYLKMYLYTYFFPKRPILISVLSILNVYFFLIKFNVPIKKFSFKGFFCIPK